MSNDNLNTFSPLTTEETMELSGGGPWAIVWGIIEGIMYVDEHWDDWKSDFKKGMDAYPYR